MRAHYYPASCSELPLPWQGMLCSELPQRIYWHSPPAPAELGLARYRRVQPIFAASPRMLSCFFSLLTTAFSTLNSSMASANANISRFEPPTAPASPLPAYQLFHNKTRAFVYGMQPRACQGMLDFDFICKRSVPSVAAIIYPFGGQFVSKMYWGTKETLLPVYQAVKTAAEKHPEVDVVVNFASSRSVYSSTMEILEIPQIRVSSFLCHYG